MAARPYFYALGKRKSAIAKVRLFQDGEGKASVNDGVMQKYFFSTLSENAVAPLASAALLKKVHIEATVQGGGRLAQSDATRPGISRALVLMDPALPTPLKQAGFPRRDTRIKERKKPGLKRARRAPQ